MTRRRIPSSSSLAWKCVELAIVAPQVASHRLLRMMLASGKPSARDRREFERMVVEKQVVFVESFSAMAINMLRANQAIAASVLGSRGRAFTDMLPKPAAQAKLRRAGVRLLSAGLAPVHRKATANARRLRRTKPFSR
jgi:hypothetical protein